DVAVSRSGKAFLSFLRKLENFPPATVSRSPYFKLNSGDSIGCENDEICKMLPWNDRIHHGSLQSSGARLRTRSGCGECRRRRKKCDEKRPRCGGCTRNDLECRWPSEVQSIDRRRYLKAENKSRVVELVINHSPAASLPPVVAMPGPFHQEEHSQLYRYFAHSVNPCLVRRTSLSRYSENSYILRLALAHPPLMAVLIAVAAISTPSQSPRRISLAVESYLFAIGTVKTGILEGKYAGNEDWLLATTTFLCIFENGRYDTMPNASSHILACGKMLTLRKPKPRNSSQEAIVLERICIESFLYHAALMTLFDPSVDYLSIIKRDLDLPGYFTDPAHPDDAGPGTLVSTQPVLDASYKFFLLIADVTAFAQSSTLTRSVDYRAWANLRDMIVHWEEAIRTNSTNAVENHIGNLYAIALRILLVQTDPGYSNPRDPLESVEILFCRGLKLLTELSVDQLFLYYYLWPLLVVGSVAVEPEEKQIIKQKLSQVSQSRQGGPAALAKYRLEKVWLAGSRCGEQDRHCTLSTQLKTLLEGN
ncbi:hypothetical protein ARAM_000566, partial [Aspergillus rambellii]